MRILYVKKILKQILEDQALWRLDRTASVYREMGGFSGSV